MRTETARAKPGKTAKPKEEPYDEWLDKRCDAAEAEAKANGWISHEQSNKNFLKRRADYLKKHHQKAA